VHSLLYRGRVKDALWRSPAGRVELIGIMAAVPALPYDRIMLNGEAVAHCLDGLPHFHRLLGDGQGSASLYAFDLLALNDVDLRPLPLRERRKRLYKALRRAPAAIRLAFLAACRLGLEGVESKRLDRAYRSGRCARWLKMRNPA
jgi:bifunctional non-homologous end joining protein LigD